MAKTYHIITFGCRANLADSERIEHKLQMEGYKKAKDEESADMLIINGCSVRKAAVDRVYSKVKNWSARGGSASGKKIILAGCFLDADKKNLEKQVDEIWHPDEYFDLAPIHSNPLNANIPIMTGCDNFCTYCAVPYTRGRERSQPTEEIIYEVKKLIKKEYKEIWLLGQNINSYKSEKVKFHDLLKMINDISGEFLIHFISSHPKDFSDELIDTISKCEKVSREIHLPVQSGDNEILKKMNRKYTVEGYKRLIAKIRQEIPKVKISTDIIVGFPGETKKQFQNTVNLFEEIRFEKAYICKYSPRKGTLAEKMKDDVPFEEKKRRWKILNDIANPLWTKEKKLS